MTTRPPAFAARKKVWIADDSPLDAERAGRVLGERWEVRIFTDGSAVLEHLAAHSPPDVLVLDWIMPGVSGIEVVRYLRSAGGKLPELPVLLLTANGQPEQIAEGLTAGANDFVGKPFSPQELIARVESLLRSAQLLERASAAERSVRLLLAHAPDALVAVDGSALITFANAEAGRLFGCQDESLSGKQLDQMLPDLWASVSMTRSVDAQVSLPDVQIGERVFSPSIRGWPPTSGASTTIALRDVTDRRHADERRLDLYSIVAHDLRSPLGAMMLRLEMILKGKGGPLSADLTRDLQRQTNSLRTMAVIINDFLDLARLEGSDTKIKREELDLRTVISNTIEELRPLADAGGLQVRWIPPSEPLPVLADRSRLGQVLSNLIGNAIKFTPPQGEITAMAQVSRDAVEISIQDTGPGIEPAALPHLFDRFTRAEQGSRRTVGSGLGLMIVREIIEAHQGKVGVNTKLGEGSTFWFSLPSRAASSVSPPP